jgi:hypothetical protein
MTAIPQSNNEDVTKSGKRKGEHRSKCGQKQERGGKERHKREQGEGKREN